MTDEIEEEEVREETEELTVEEHLPFLRIANTYPNGAGRVETLTLELNLRDDDPVGDYDSDHPGESGAAKSWVLDLVATTIRAMHAGSVDPAIVVTGPGVHAPGCNGSCGMPTTTTAAGSAGDDNPKLGHTGSDRWTGGDRKDEP